MSNKRVMRKRRSVGFCVSTAGCIFSLDENTKTTATTTSIYCYSYLEMWRQMSAAKRRNDIEKVPQRFVAKMCQTMRQRQQDSQSTHGVQKDTPKIYKTFAPDNNRWSCHRNYGHGRFIASFSSSNSICVDTSIEVREYARGEIDSSNPFCLLTTEKESKIRYRSIFFANRAYSTIPRAPTRSRIFYANCRSNKDSIKNVQGI